jgi:hypothetical protein
MYNLYDFVCYDLLHILLSCDKIMDPWNVYKYICMYVYMYVCIYVCMYICMYVYMYVRKID